MWLAKLWYVCWGGGMVFLIPFIPLLLDEAGLTSEQIGIVSALRPWLAAPFGILLARLADATHAHTAVLVVCWTASTALRSSLLWVPALPALVAALVLAADCVGAPCTTIVDATVVGACKEYGKQRLWASLAWGGLSTLAGEVIHARGIRAGILVYSAICLPAGLVALAFRRKAVAVMAARNAAAAAAARDLMPELLADQGANSQGAGSCSGGGGSSAEQGAQPAQAGKPRAQQSAGGRGAGGAVTIHVCTAVPGEGLAGEAGEVGWGPAAGVQPASHHISAAGSLLAHALSGDAAAAERLPRGSASADASLRQPLLPPPEPALECALAGEAAVLATAGGGEGAGLCSLLASPLVLVFLAQALLLGFGHGAISAFLFLHVQRCGGTDVLMGAMLAANVATEAPALALLTRIMARVPVKALVNLVLLTMAARLACYVALPWLASPWPVLGIEMLHGLTYGIGWGACTVHCKALAPPQLAATMNGLFAGVWTGVGSGLGGLVGGLLMARYGGQAMFGACSAIMLAGWALCYAGDSLLACCAARRRRRQPRC